jgi:hypothetical protein
MQVALAVRQGDRPDRPVELVRLEDDLWTLINRCWCDNASSRPRIREVAQDVRKWIPVYMGSSLIIFSTSPAGIHSYREEQNQVSTEPSLFRPFHWMKMS